MFTIPLYQYKIENWETKKQELLEVCSSIDFVNQQSNDSKSSKVNALSDNLYTDYGNDGNYRNKVIHILKKELIRFSEESNIKNMLVSDTWFQQYYKSQFHSPHNHGAIGYSSVTYIKFDKKIHQSTTFVAPYNDPMGNQIYHIPDVDEGHIIFFPSMVTHYVLPSKTNDIRIIMSMNVKGS